MTNLPVFNIDGKEVENIKLNASVFDGTVNTDAIYQAVNAYRANQRQGTASTKTRGEVSGGGKKPWKQKGTGRARVGSTRSPLWRHGGVVFGPHPRDFYLRIPQKIKSLALRSALNAKVKDNAIVVLDGLKLPTQKTKDAAKIFSNLKIEVARKKGRKNLLVLAEKFDTNTRRAMSNINFLNMNSAKDTHVYEVMVHDRLVITKDGLAALTNRLK